MTSKKPAASSTHPNWTLSQIVDFESRIHLDQKLDPNTLEQRDRTIRKSLPSNSPQTNSSLLQHWLAYFKKSPFDTPSVGETIQASSALGSKLIYLLYSLFGLLLGFQLLSYNGNEPVNVSAFLGLVILLQIAFVLLSTFLILVGIPKPSSLELSPTMRIARASLWSLSALILRLNRFSTDSHQHQFQLAFLGRLKGRLWLYNTPIRWLSFNIANKSGIAFNSGICLAILAAVTFSDRAFGWQTSLDLSAATIHSFASQLSLPWAWLFGEGTGYPSLDQITGSQIILKDGIRTLNTADLTSWWSFLLLATFTYGLLPRVLLSAISSQAYNKSLKQIDFHDAESQRIIRRLLPENETFAVDHPLSSETDSPSSHPKSPASPTPPPPTTSQTIAWVTPSLWNKPDIQPRLTEIPVSYTHLTLPTNREV